MAFVMEGPLSKWTNVMQGWQYRWFVLDYSAGLLSYYTSKDKMMRGSRRGCVRLRGAVIGIDDEDDSTFTITVDQKTFHFQARDADEREKWIGALEDTIQRHSLQLRDPELNLTPGGGDFERKLAEADAYLQILIEQQQCFDEKLKLCKDEEQRRKVGELKGISMNMVESIKHCIVLLQIAKSSLNPVEAVRSGDGEEAAVVLAGTASGRPELTRAGSHGTAGERQAGGGSAESRPTTLDVSSPAAPSLGIAKSPPAPPHAGAGNGEDGSGSSGGGGDDDDDDDFEEEAAVVLTSPRDAAGVPHISYSSSEDEFYDANDSDANDSTSPKPPRTSLGASGLKHPATTESLVSIASGCTNDERYDAQDENDSEEGESVEDHKSVIMHLLSQVKLGMDLTKVVLPTFILERRSLLEMYADFFAHPDLFVSVAGGVDARERMVGVVRWYLSSFHAGRKGSVAKKPYNPILGETFHCHWTVPDHHHQQQQHQQQQQQGEVVAAVPAAPAEETSELAADGPVPWATKGSVTFIAEQVSHHPPISAFYAECHSRRIQFNAHIWTKSKFLGMSIGVHNIGQGCVSLLDHDEDYIITFPNGYGRSILTVPWVELGGECTISCAKSGFTATVNFHTKPFYGGSKHRISAEILSPNEKKPFVLIEGEWNGTMHAKWSTGESSVFVDTKSIPITKKKVRRIEDQGEFESRRLWRDVTSSLKAGDIDRATDAKHYLEEQQRAEARGRKESGDAWRTKLFHEDGECWIYDNPLIKRLAPAQE
ncbi:oxysterol-binding protein-related protein 9-like isoform X2 [Lethenteron reissneri]|uniref:oxysterol-binding protein-related protein 9-like isoform X2 n=1 Tax=Lethenteron reissneri TaxID=7753 RepID=UPI002AB72EE6|nr:oxysterol-binding protein-related protein 9-like isoform X2 [Lethenteron reissneri]XP_061413845.1 oxysterol-binding protein-related protein 9-like isoform X2 [Lethenteron reissneri]